MRPPLDTGLVAKGIEFKDPHLQQDVKDQHERLAANQVAQGLVFPKPGSEEWNRHPVRRWTGTASHNVTNYWLEKASNKKTSMYVHTGDLAHALDTHLHGSVALPEDVHAYSGVGHVLGEKLASLKPGARFKNPAPISTSLSPGIAFNRMGQHLMHVHFPAGSSPGIYAGKMGGSFEQEAELLLKRKVPLIYKGATKFAFGHGSGYEGGSVHHFDHDPTVKW